MIKVERVISWFDKNTEELKGEYLLDDFPLESLLAIFRPQENDPLMYDCYLVLEPEATKINEQATFVFDFERYDYYVECFQAG